MNSYDIIKRPILTEKSYAGIPAKTYTFEVVKTANKVEIKKSGGGNFRRQGRKSNYGYRKRQAQKTRQNARSHARLEEGNGKPHVGQQGNRVLRKLVLIMEVN